MQTELAIRALSSFRHALHLPEFLMKTTTFTQALAAVLLGASAMGTALAAPTYQFRVTVAGLSDAPSTPASEVPPTPEPEPTPPAPVLASCLDVLGQNPAAASGTYPIVVGGQSTTVFCDMVSDGGGWTLVAKIGNVQSWVGQIGDVALEDLVSPAIVAESFSKLSDAKIASIPRTTTKIYSLLASGPRPIFNNFLPGACPLEFNAPAAVPGPCATVYGDAALTSPFTAGAATGSIITPGLVNGALNRLVLGTAAAPKPTISGVNKHLQTQIWVR